MNDQKRLLRTGIGLLFFGALLIVLGFLPFVSMPASGLLLAAGAVLLLIGAILSGASTRKTTPCPECDGTGYIEQSANTWVSDPFDRAEMLPVRVKEREVCSRCNGTGRL